MKSDFVGLLGQIRKIEQPKDEAAKGKYVWATVVADGKVDSFAVSLVDLDGQPLQTPAVGMECTVRSYTSKKDGQIKFVVDLL